MVVCEARNVRLMYSSPTPTEFFGACTFWRVHRTPTLMTRVTVN